MVDIDPAASTRRGSRRRDVVNAIGVQNLILPRAPPRSEPTNTGRRSTRSPTTIAELNDLPVKTVGRRAVYVRDVA